MMNWSGVVSPASRTGAKPSGHTPGPRRAREAKPLQDLTEICDFIPPSLVGAARAAGNKLPVEAGFSRSRDAAVLVGDLQAGY